VLYHFQGDPMQSLTLNQRRILDFIDSYQNRIGVPPTYEVIGKEFGYTAKSTVQHYVEVLIKKGYLTKERHLSNGLTLHKEGNLIPLLGQVAAGRPLERAKFDERLEVPLKMLKGSGPFFALEVVGDSMIGEGIIEGDYVVVREQKTAQNGELIVAEIENEATLKRFFKKKTHIELHAANPKYKPIRVEASQDLRIAGVFHGLIRYAT
jgi:repressor LexA